jgi:hypothetical protein
MARILLNAIERILEWAGRRATRGVSCHVREAKRAGGEGDPAAVATVVVENPQGENAFVGSFEVEMLEPFRSPAAEYEYRSDPRTPIYNLALNIPGHGMSDPVIVIAKFQGILPYTSACRARIAAVGRKGFRKRWAEFCCPSLQ